MQLKYTQIAKKKKKVGVSSYTFSEQVKTQWQGENNPCLTEDSNENLMGTSDQTNYICGSS